MSAPITASERERIIAAEFGVRAANALAMNYSRPIEYLDELLELTVSDLRKMKNVGEATIMVITAALAKRGLQLGQRRRYECRRCGAVRRSAEQVAEQLLATLAVERDAAEYQSTIRAAAANLRGFCGPVCAERRPMRSPPRRRRTKAEIARAQETADVMLEDIQRFTPSRSMRPMLHELDREPSRRRRILPHGRER